MEVVKTELHQSLHQLLQSYGLKQQQSQQQFQHQPQQQFKQQPHQQFQQQSQQQFPHTQSTLPQGQTSSPMSGYTMGKNVAHSTTQHGFASGAQTK
eukprot:7565348-Ditylum_brightwellii.AAC.1